MLESSEWHGMREDVQSVGNHVAEVGLQYFCPDYVSKNGVSVTEHNMLLLCVSTIASLASPTSAKTQCLI